MILNIGPDEYRAVGCEHYPGESREEGWSRIACFMNFLTALMLAEARMRLWRFVILGIFIFILACTIWGIFMALKTALRILNHSRQ